MTFGELTSILLFEKNNYKAIYDGLHALHDFYAGVTGITAEHTTDNNIYLPSGKAISPGQAASCLVDVQRTTVFLRGVREAILKLKEEVDGPVNILYAGCGPYASLLTPLTTIFKPEEVRFYIMDVNAESIAAVERLYQCLGATAYIGDLICADAATYRIDKPMHLVVSETMQSALKKEPQVAVMQNLIPQINAFSEGSIFIPQEIIITAQLVDREAQMRSYFENGKRTRVNLGTVYSISKENCNGQEPASIRIPEDIGSFNELYLITEVVVFEDERLGPNDCGVTMPVRVGDVAGEKGKELRFEYVCGEVPGFRWEVLNAVGALSGSC